MHTDSTRNGMILTRVVTAQDRLNEPLSMLAERQSFDRDFEGVAKLRALLALPIKDVLAAFDDGSGYLDRLLAADELRKKQERIAKLRDELAQLENEVEKP